MSEDGSHRTYIVSGQIFFLSKEEFLDSFDFGEVVDTVTIDLTNAHLWDQGAVAILDRIVLKFRRNGADVELLGLNEASATLVEKLGVHNQTESLRK